MTHQIWGFIGRHDLLREAVTALDGEQVVPLGKEFGFLPLVEHLHPPRDPGLVPGLQRLTGRLAVWAVEQSRRLTLAYIETCYWAGRGKQGAVVWQNGVVVLGPVVTSNEDGAVPVAPLERAINRAARVLGVVRDGAFDEFDAWGLGRHRSNGVWLTKAEPRPPEVT